MSNTRDTDTNNQEYTIPVIEIDAYAPVKMADSRLYHTWYAAPDAG